VAVARGLRRRFRGAHVGDAVVEPGEPRHAAASRAAEGSGAADPAGCRLRRSASRRGVVDASERRVPSALP
jgi:hypothetical protein